MKMVSYFGDHPLALAAAAGFLLAHPSVSAGTYMSSQKLQEDDSTSVYVDEDRDRKNLFFVLRTTVTTMEKEHPEAAKALKFLTLLHYNTVPFSHIVSFLKLMDAKATADQVLSVLHDQSLIEIEKSDKQNDVKVSMHEYVHELINRQIPEVEKRELLAKAIQVVTGPFKGPNSLMVQRILRELEYLMHARQILEEAKKLNYASMPLLSLQIRVLDCVACGQRNFEEAKALIADIQQTEERLEIS